MPPIIYTISAVLRGHFRIIAQALSRGSLRTSFLFTPYILSLFAANAINQGHKKRFPIVLLAQVESTDKKSTAVAYGTAVLFAILL